MKREKEPIAFLYADDKQVSAKFADILAECGDICPVVDISKFENVDYEIPWLLTKEGKVFGDENIRDYLKKVCYLEQ